MNWEKFLGQYKFSLSTALYSMGTVCGFSSAILDERGKNPLGIHKYNLETCKLMGDNNVICNTNNAEFVSKALQHGVGFSKCRLGLIHAGIPFPVKTWSFQRPLKKGEERPKEAEEFEKLELPSYVIGISEFFYEPLKPEDINSKQLERAFRDFCVIIHLNQEHLISESLRKIKELFQEMSPNFLELTEDDLEAIYNEARLSENGITFRELKKAHESDKNKSATIQKLNFEQFLERMELFTYSTRSSIAGYITDMLKGGLVPVFKSILQGCTIEVDLGIIKVRRNF